MVVSRLAYMLFFAGAVQLLAVAGLADETMDRIAATGVLRIGFREDAIPFSYLDPESGQHVGFSVDMAALLVQNLSKRFRREVKIHSVAVKPKTRIAMIVNDVIDVEMGASTYTKAREDVVDFSLIFFVSETTFMAPATLKFQTLSDLNHKRIGCAAGTTNHQVVREAVAAGRFAPQAIVLTDTHAEGIQLLKKGLIDAYATDRIILNVMRIRDENPQRWQTADFAIGYEPYAYLLREGNSDFRDFLNNTIRWSILSGAYDQIYQKWMGPTGVCPYKMPPTFKEYLNIIVYPMKEDWWKE